MERQATTPGTYPVTETMPCPPDEVRVGRYLAPNTLGKAEAEEAGARLVTFCQQAGQWCGMGATNLIAMLEEELRLIAEQRAANERNIARNDLYQRELYRYRTWCFWTCGLYSLFVQQPTFLPEQLPKPPFTVIRVNPELLFNGFHWLAEKGYAVHRREGGEEGEDVFYPTAKLIHALRGNRQVE